MYSRTKVGPSYFASGNIINTLQRAEGVPQGGEYSDISYHKGSQPVDVGDITRETSGSKCKQ